MKFRKSHAFYLIIVILIITISFLLLTSSEIRSFDNCSSIEKGIKRDNCYIELVLEGNYNVCNKISNQYTKKSCFALKSSSKEQKDIILIEDILPQPIKP
jgi:hypothetical protein